MNRPLRIVLIVAAVLLFLGASGFLARYLTTDNAERNADLNLLKAEAAGSWRSMVDQIQGCAADPRCVALQQRNAARLQRPGQVKILQLISATANAPDTQTGPTRVAWTVIGRLPVVQCITVHRTGNALSGLSVTLLGLSAPIDNAATC
jgi:hypothetical protein